MTTLSSIENDVLKWNNSQSLNAKLTTLVGAVVGFIVLIHPGWTEPTIVQTLVPSVSFVIAGSVQIFDAITHRNVLKAVVNHTKPTVATSVSSTVTPVKNVTK